MLTEKNRETKENAAMAAEEEKGRAGHLDAARGIGIILVLAGHMFPYGDPLSCSIFSFHVPLFFYLSGEVAALKNPGIRPGRLLLPYLYACLLGTAVTALLPWLRGSLSPAVRMVKDLYRASPERLHVGPVWFLFCLFWVELGFFLYRQAIARAGERGALLCRTLPALLFAAGVTVVPRIAAYFPFGRMPLQADTAFAAFGTYAAGNLVGEKLARGRGPGGFFLDAAAAAGVLLAGRLNGWVNISLLRFGNPVLYLLLAAAGIRLSLRLGRLLEHSRWICFLGRNSLFIFALHPLFNQGYYWLLSFGGYVYPGDLNYGQAALGTAWSLAVRTAAAAIYRRAKQKRREEKKCVSL